MPIRRRRTKPGIKVRGPIQNVKQSVKVIIQAPAKPVRRRRATTGAKKGDIFSNLMRAPEYTTFRDLTPVSASTGYVPTQPQQPFRTDLNQLRIEDQDRIGSVSGGLSVAPQGLLPGPKPEEKKPDPYDYQDVTENVSKMEKEQENRKAGFVKQSETKKKQKEQKEADKKAKKEALEKEALEKVLKADTFRKQSLKKSAFGGLKQAFEEAKNQKADTFRNQRLMKSAFGGLKQNVLEEKSSRSLMDQRSKFAENQRDFGPPPQPKPKKAPLFADAKKQGLFTTDEALRKMKSISKKADK